MDYVLPPTSPALPVEESPIINQSNSNSVYPDMSLPRDDSPKPMTNLEDNISSKVAAYKSDSAASAPFFSDWDAENAGRFVNSENYSTQGHDPFLGEQYNEFKYGEAQTGWEKFKNATVGGVKRFGHGFYDQAASWKDTISVLGDADLTAAFQKDELEEIARKDKELQNENPIYQSEYDTKNFFSWGNLARQVQGTGHLMGSVAEMIAENAAAMAVIAGTFGTAAPELGTIEAARDAEFIAKATNNALQESVTLSRTIDRADKMKKAFAAYRESPSFQNAVKSASAWSAAKIGAPLGEAVQGAASLLPASNTARFVGQGLIDLGAGTADLARANSKLRTIGKGVGALYMDARDLNLSISMAQSNASALYHTMVSDWSSEYKQRTGKDPAGNDLSNIQELALKASKTNGAIDALAMLYTNKLAFGNILRGNNAISHLVAEQGSGMLSGIKVIPEFLRKEGGAKLVANPRWLSAAYHMSSIPSTLGHGLGFGLTVATSAAISEASKAYFDAKYNNKSISWAKALKEGVDSQFTKEGAQTFLSSFLLGALVPGVGFEKIKKGFENIDRVYNKSGWENRTAEQKQSTQEFVTKFNEFYNDPISPIRENLARLTVQTSIKQLKEVASILKDKKLFNDLHDDALREFIIPAIRNGHTNIYLDHLTDFVENLSPKEFFEALLPGVKYDENVDLATLLQNQVKEFKGRAMDLDRIYKDVYRKFPNPFNPFKYKGDPEKFEQERNNFIGYQTAVDFTIFSKDKVERSLERQSQILNGDGVNGGLRGMEIFKSVPFSSLYNFTDNLYLSGVIETLKSEQEVLTGSEKAKNEKQLAAYERYNESLLAYKTDYQDIVKIKNVEERRKAEAELDKKYSEIFKTSFTDVLNVDLKEDGKYLSEADKEAAIAKYLDYYKLGVESDNNLRFYNVVIDPRGGWGEYTKAVIKAYSDHLESEKEIASEEAGKGFIGNRYWVDGTLYTITKVDPDGTLHYTYEDEEKTVYGKWSRDYFDENVKDNLYQEVSQKENLTDRSYDVTAKEGRKLTFRAGDIWVRPPKQDQTGIWDNEKEGIIKKNNKIKILSISPDGKDAYVVIDGKPKAKYTLQSLADLAEETKWINYEELNPDQQEYLNLRNFGIRYTVMKRDANGKVITSKTGRPILEEVTGRVVLDENKETLLFAYNNERSGKIEKIPFDRKYVVNKAVIEPRSVVEQRAAERRQARLESNYHTQRTRFETLLRDTESKIAETIERRTINKSRYEEHLKEFETLKKQVIKYINTVVPVLDTVSSLFTEGQKDLIKAQESFKGKDFSRTKEAKEYKKILKEYKKILSDLEQTKSDVSPKIARFEETLASLKAEREELEKLQETLEQSREFQYDVLSELELTERPFDRAGRKSLYEDLIERKDTIEEFRATRKPEKVDEYLQDTRAEIKAIDERMDVLTGIISSARDFLSSIEGLGEIYDHILEKAALGTRQLKSYLWELRESSDPKTREVALDLFEVFSLSEGDPRTFIEAAHIKKIIKEAQSSIKEFDEISKKKDALLEKEERLTRAQEQNRELSELNERIDYLMKVQEALSTIPPQEIKRNLSWNEEKEDFDNKNKDIATDTTPDNEGGFFSEPPTRNYNGSLKPFFQSGALLRTQGRQYEPEHFLLDDGHGITKLYINRNGKVIEAKVLDKAKYPKARAEYLQNVANAITKDGTLFSSIAGEETVFHYAPGKADIKITRHENDSQLNPDEKNAEAHFLNANIDIKNIKLSVITADNDVYGIRNTQAYNDDIKVLYVNQDGKPIDVDGKVIDNPSKENVIYRSLQGFDALLDHTDLPDTLEGKTEEETKKKMRAFEQSKVFKAMDSLFDIKRDKYGVIKYDTLRAVFREAKEFKALREKLKAEVKQNGYSFLTVLGKSQGIPNELPKVNGSVQKYSVEGRITEENTDWRSPKAPNGMGIELKISNTSDIATKGIKPGRLVWVREDGLRYPGENRALSKAERTNIISALKYYSKFHYKDYNELVTERGEKEATRISNDMNKLRILLNSTLFWGPPSEIDLKSGDINKIGKNRIWISQDFLYRTTKNGIEKVMAVSSELSKPENQNLILDGIFHQVNKKMLEKTEPFDTYTVTENKDGSFSMETHPYENYLEYIATSKDEDGVPVVYTNLVSHKSPVAGELLTLTTPLKQVNLLFKGYDSYTPTPQQAARNLISLDIPEEPTSKPESSSSTPSPVQENKNKAIDEDGIVINDTEFAAPFFDAMEQEIESSTGLVTELKPGINLRQTNFQELGIIRFLEIEGRIVKEEDSPGNGPRLHLFKEETAEEIVSAEIASTPLVEEVPPVPQEPPVVETISEEVPFETEETNEEKSVSLPSTEEAISNIGNVPEQSPDESLEELKKLFGDDLNACDTSINF